MRGRGHHPCLHLATPVSILRPVLHLSSFVERPSLHMQSLYRLTYNDFHRQNAMTSLPVNIPRRNSPVGKHFPETNLHLKHRTQLAQASPRPTNIQTNLCAVNKDLDQPLYTRRALQGGMSLNQLCNLPLVSQQKQNDPVNHNSQKRKIIISTNLSRSSPPRHSRQRRSSRSTSSTCSPRASS